RPNAATAPRPAISRVLGMRRNSNRPHMILGDRVVCALPYSEALGYATLLARRLAEVFAEINPGAVIGGFVAIHGSLALAVARNLGIPWFALHFSTIPQGLACFCDRESPSAR